MSYEFLQVIWFILIAILWIGFFFLEGFDFGVGMLLPFLGKTDAEKRAIINTIGPHWDGNEVWLLVAGGATFAAFPHWYATLFSGFYPALFLLLVGLIIRGVGFEFRSKDKNIKWRSLWDWCIFTGSFLPALLLGVAFANMAKGIPIDGTMTYTGNLITLLNPYGLIGGLALVALFLLHGINFLNMKLSGEVLERSRRITPIIWLIAFVFLASLVIPTLLITDGYTQKGALIFVAPFAALAALLTAGYLNRAKREGWAFILTGLAVILVPVTYFHIMFPRVMVSSTNPDFSLTITNASSTAYTLNVMSIVALIFVPIVLAYQIWSYWVFRKRISVDSKGLHY
ncbi:MAG TPA: cytochrome d ubiquinol oxidase subunit II [Anaerolineales bacterium]|nr:cytochrome d ubiquinol oxidase subunit II [Anaerolineales bacterium]